MSQAAHGKRVEATYGITEAEYWHIYEAQGGRCYIDQRSNGSRRRLAVDHDHKCTQGHAPEAGCRKCVRGLICKSCNRLLGFARDDPEFFRRAMEYLINPPARKVLDAEED